MTETVEIRVDEKLHPAGPPPDELHRIGWAGADTAWNLLVDTATRLAFTEAREQAELEGREVPGLTIEAVRPTIPESLHALLEFTQAFEHLAHIATQRAEEAAK